jgi:cell division protein FtsW (lipid II flippase)
MADVSEKSSASSLLVGLLLFISFETVAFYGLQYLTSGLGESNQYQPENTIVSNWVKTMVFFVAHLVLVITAMLVLNNRLPRRYRGQVMGWFYLALVMSFVLIIPLFGTTD